MTDPAPPSDPTGAPPTPAALLAAEDIRGLMRACHDRRLEREGIPMVLGLADERRALPANPDAAQRAEGGRYADVFDRYSAALVPFARDDDEGAVITAMQVVGYTHFRPGAEPVTDDEETGR